MAKASVKPGDDINWSGQIIREGVSDFSGYTLTSQIRSRSCVDGSMTTLQASADIEWVDEAAGLFTYRVSRADTVKWPENQTLYMDIRVEAPGGAWVRTDTVELKTIAGVTK